MLLKELKDLFVEGSYYSVGGFLGERSWSGPHPMEIMYVPFFVTFYGLGVLRILLKTWMS